MYWNNPIIEYRWPSDVDPIATATHNGQHCLFYDPNFDQSQIPYQQRLQDLSAWANRLIAEQGTGEFLQDPQNHYDIANLVKLNMWIDSIRKQGIVKPMLVSYANGKYIAATGESRLRALECIPEITSVTAFIDTKVEHQDQFQHLELVTTFDQFATLCGAVANQTFLFRFTDDRAPYGLDWYEYNSQQTSSVTPGQDYCVAAVTAYLDQHPDTVFSPGWFGQLVNWNHYKNF
jgi:ParB-like nuclease domain